jgi:hypothetical protein
MRSLRDRSRRFDNDRRTDLSRDRFGIQRGTINQNRKIVAGSTKTTAGPVAEKEAENIGLQIK